MTGWEEKIKLVVFKIKVPKYVIVTLNLFKTKGNNLMENKQQTLKALSWGKVIYIWKSDMFCKSLD